MDRIIPAVHEHIVPEKTLAGAAIGVCVEEALDDGVVISGLEVIEARLYDGEIARRSKTGAQKLQKRGKEDRRR